MEFDYYEYPGNILQVKIFSVEKFLNFAHRNFVCKMGKDDAV